MKSLLTGVVRDHRLPCDYKLGYAQPMTTKTFITGLKKTLKNRLVTHQYASLPMVCFFGFACPFFLL